MQLERFGDLFGQVPDRAARRCWQTRLAEDLLAHVRCVQPRGGGVT